MPSNPIVRKVSQLFDQRRYSDVLSECDAALAQADDLALEALDRAKLFMTRGNTLALLKRYDEAVRSVTSALDWGPGEPAFLFERALLLIDVGDFATAIEDCTEGLRAEEGAGRQYYSKVLHFARAVARLRACDLDGAAADCAELRDGDVYWIERRLWSKEDLLKAIEAARGTHAGRRDRGHR